MNIFKRFQKPEPPPPPAVPDAEERPTLETSSTQHNLCYWASRDVPHTQLRFLSIWTNRATGQADIGIKVMAPNDNRYWVYASIPAGQKVDPNSVEAVLKPLFAANGAPNAPFFPALPTLFQIADNGLLPASVLRTLVFSQLQHWDAANIRNFNESIIEKLTTEQALRRRLGREWMTNSPDVRRRVPPPSPSELEYWWRVVTDPDRVLGEVSLCSKLAAQYQAISGSPMR